MNSVTAMNLQPRLLSLLAAPLAAAIMMALPTAANAGIDVSINIAPPEIPVYEQPAMPGDGYMWTPGYWAYGEEYYWVPGTWVRPPMVGVLWTPGYWAYEGGHYGFHGGYWGPHIGFYGGVNYGFGYGGRGYEGGYWNHGAFFYNRSVNAMGGIHVVNVYERPVTNITVGHVGFNGGPGGVDLHISVDEQRAEHEHHEQPIADQQHQREMASRNPELKASVNHGAPAIAATPKAGVFEGPGVAHATGAAADDHATAKPVEDDKAKATDASGQEAAKTRDDAKAKADVPVDTRDATKPQDEQPKAEPKAADATADAPKQKHHHSQSPPAANGAPTDQPEKGGQAKAQHEPKQKGEPKQKDEPASKKEDDKKQQ